MTPDARTRRPRGIGRVDPVLVGLLGIALGLRLWGITYGLPDVYNPDEVSILSRALALADHGLNPKNFVYPSLYFYLLAAGTGLLYAIERVTGAVGSLAAFQQAYWHDATAWYVMGRSLSAVAGVASVSATYALARQIGGATLARSAACLMAVAYFPVRDAHMIKHDVITALLVVVVVLASRQVWRRGTTSDYVRAGALSGATLAFHYYAAFVCVPVVVAHGLRVGWRREWLRDRRPWLAALAGAAAFALLSPYVLIDYRTALRDIAGNRQILIDRVAETFGWLGSGRVHLTLLTTQGAGWLMSVAAAGGGWVLARRSWREALWLLAFPIVFFLFLTQAWPFGRLENALFPFIAVTGAFGIEWAARRTGRPALAAALLTAACAAQPLIQDVLLDRLLTRPDTRTDARRWIEGHLPAESGIAVQKNSVPLEPTREWLRAVLAETVPHGPLPARARGQLARDPYPSPAYRLFQLGKEGLDRDRVFIDPDDLLTDDGLDRLRGQGVAFVVLKHVALPVDDPARRRLAARAELVYQATPFAPGVDHGDAQLPDIDVRPSFSVRQPGPIIEVWRLGRPGSRRP